jgi:hypothetical protein
MEEEAAQIGGRRKLANVLDIALPAQQRRGPQGAVLGAVIAVVDPGPQALIEIRGVMTRKKVNKGLKAKLDIGAISPSNSDAVTQALAVPENTPKGQTALAYRNRLAHHIRPSVDYSMFFSALESRAGEELTAADGDMFRRLGLPLMRDAQGKGIARRHSVSAGPPVQCRFQDLYAALSEYLDALVAMLQQLSQIDILRR